MVVDKGRWYLLPFFRSSPMEAPTDRLSVEIWQDILLFAIEPDLGASVFATTCTASTFLHFTQQENDSYHKYTRGRTTLRQVCRAWNEFLLSTKSWWIHVHNPDYPKQQLALPSIPDQVRTVKRLSMIIAHDDRDGVGPSVDWASDLLARARAPLISYDVMLPSCYHTMITCRKRHEPHDFLPAVGPNMALRSLRIVFPPRNQCRAISFPQLNTHFKNLVSLSLCNLVMLSTRELTLPHLELLHLTKRGGAPPFPTEAWDLPRLRHVYFDGILNEDVNTLLNWLLRYASQLETLFLMQYESRGDLPHNFWDTFTVLQMLGLRYEVLNDCDWGGWTTTPPRTHPFRYFVCRHYEDDVAATVDSLRSKWTYHEEVALVIKRGTHGTYYLIEDIKAEGWKTRMIESNGVLPDSRQSFGITPVSGNL